MAFCTNCGNPMPENATFCEKCGAPAGYQPSQNPYSAPYTQVYVDPHDHTADFDPADISENKVYAMAAYLFSVLGIILAVLAARDSKYAAFHAHQSLKLTIVTTLIAIVSTVLCWTVIVPIAGGVCALILLVIRIICFIQICGGKAKDAPIISSLSFMN